MPRNPRPSEAERAVILLSGSGMEPSNQGSNVRKARSARHASNLDSLSFPRYDRPIMNKLPRVPGVRAITSSTLRRLRRVIQAAACILVLAHSALAFTRSSPPSPTPCRFVDPSAGAASDNQGSIHYEAAIQQLFAAHKFE